MDSKFSPDGKYISYICNDKDIFIMNLETIKEKRLTNNDDDNKKNIRNGIAEFIIQEEFDRYTGYWWNKNEKTNKYQIVYLEIDESEVPILKISESGRSRECEEYKYPRPGDKNAISKLKLISFSKNNENEIKNEELKLECDWLEYVTR